MTEANALRTLALWCKNFGKKSDWLYTYKHDQDKKHILYKYLFDEAEKYGLVCFLYTKQRINVHLTDKGKEQVNSYLEFYSL